MDTTGGLFLLLAIGVVVFVGMNAASSLTAEAQSTNNTSVISAVNSATPIENSVFTAFGYVGLAVAAIALISAFKNM